MFKSYYYQFINFIQEMSKGWFVAIWLVLLAAILLCVMTFFKENSKANKKFVKVSMMILAVLLFALLVWLTYIRK